jgi:hypothetical protein
MTSAIDENEWTLSCMYTKNARMSENILTWYLLRHRSNVIIPSTYGKYRDVITMCAHGRIMYYDYYDRCRAIETVLEIMHAQTCSLAGRIRRR